MNGNGHAPKLINVNTGVSLGLIVICLAGIWAILSAISSTKTEVGAARTELNGRFDQMEQRVKQLENNKNSWTGVDMFKWAVHLQQQNPQIKVPEPEVSTK